MHSLKSTLAAVAVTLPLAACASGSTAGMGKMAIPDGPAAGQRRDDAATVKVRNYNWSDVVVYAVDGGVRTRLGTVTTMGNATFRLPTRLVGTGNRVQLLVHPIGTVEGWTTDAFVVQGGQQVNFNVQNGLQFSSLLVASR